MEIVSLCPFRVGTVIWQPQPGAWTLTVCVKGTFALVHGREARIAETQDAIDEDRFYADNARGSLWYPSDLVPFKPRADVLVVGHACAPGGRAVDALVARFTVGDLSKSVGVIGDRVWVEGADGLEPGHPAPFPRMPLRYERIAKSAANPIGFDLARPPVAGAPALPNFESIDDVVRGGSTLGFGPIPPTWPARRNLLQGAAAAWAASRDGPAPPGFDFGFYNAAPRDQQIELLRASSKIVLENLHPDLPRIETRLPAVRPKAFLVEPGSDRTADIAMRCDTLWIDADRGVVAVTWRGLTGVAAGDESTLGRLVVALEVKGKELRYKHVEKLLREGRTTSFDPEDLASDEKNPLSVRYDGTKPGKSVAPMPSRTPHETFVPRSIVPVFEPEDATTDFRTSSPPSAALVPGRSSAPPSPAGPRVDDWTTDATTERMMAKSDSARPTLARSEPPSSIEAPATLTDASFSPDPVVGPGARPARADTLTTIQAVTDDADGDEPERAGPREVPAAAPPAAEPARDALAAKAEAPAEPPAPAPVRDVLGPTAEPPAGEPPPETASAELDGAPRASVEIPADAPAKPAGEAADGGARPPRNKAGRGGSAIELTDYARIAVGVERGETKRVLAAYNLKPAELRKLQRAWKRRAADDPALATRIAEAIEAARWE